MVNDRFSERLHKVLSHLRKSQSVGVNRSVNTVAEPAPSKSIHITSILFLLKTSVAPLRRNTQYSAHFGYVIHVKPVLRRILNDVIIFSKVKGILYWGRYHFCVPIGQIFSSQNSDEISHAPNTAPLSLQREKTCNLLTWFFFLFLAVVSIQHLTK